MKRIRTLEDLAAARDQKRAVTTVSRWGMFMRQRPAAFVINLPGAQILNLLRAGLFIYQPKTKRKKKQ